ncbi:FimV/HubP family polar landmark protein [Marinobacter vinifirmus]|uniref:FimV family protein n=1 Tax=Marinobacter vinifirmus TaxID=355591 RepID=A0A558B8Q0_9GAMM|nr:FimV/HubP family polar landmark protein [Marinobacter vinifirmus]TVT32875.1 MAG: FimV family protein [Marinobacter vinifirmus]
MKVRKLAVALALAGGLGSGMAQALGLGEIELQSWLNEPLDAEISLRQSAGVDPGDVFVNVAPEAAYQRVGLERNQFLSKLKFEVVTGSDGNLAINVSSREPVREPYLNFLLELTWPNGRLMREYAVLVDPPVYAEESGVREQVSAPVSSAASAPARQTTTRSAESLRREAAVQRAPARGYQPDSFGPTGPSDTLWTIAQRMRLDSSVSMQQMMLAIQDLNPDAFIDGNINKLKRGQVLRAPTLDQIQSRTKAEANRVVARQNEEFQSPRPVDATRAAQGETAPAQTAENAGTDELKLLVAEEETSPRTDDEGGSAGGDGEQAGGADAGNAVAMEELDATRRENEELSSRLQDMQEQVQTLQRLLELKNSQLAELQGMTQEEAAAALAAEGDSAQAGAAGTDANADGETAAATESADSEEPAAQAGESAEAREGESADTEADMAEGSADTTAAVAGAGEQAEASAAEGEGDSETAESAEATASAEAGAPAAAVAPAQEETKPQPKPSQTAPAKEKGFFGQLMDTILGNPMYQIALGGGLILLLLLLLLVARKNAKREQDFYDEFNRGEDDSADDSVDLGPAAAVAGSDQEETADALTEAETYIAYGRNDQAIEVLETAISREPSRADLRLKLLSVYADNQDRDAFEKQYGEVAALEDESALQEAEAIRGRLDEAESMPSIDDLESQLRSDSFSLTDNEPEQALSFETPEQEPEEDWSLSDELKADEFEAAADEVKENEFGELESDSSLETDADDNSVEFDLSDFELDAEDAGLDQLDSEQPAEEEIDLGLEGESLDESFLDELDAELEKVSSEEDSLEELDLEDSSLEELELDVSDEDLALMEEFSEDSESPEVDEELGLEDALQELETEEDPLGDLPVVEPEPEAEASDTGAEVPEMPEEGASDEAVTPATGLDIDESDLEDDDFDFLAGTDEAATKLDLARAYIEMGDSDGARDILEEVALEGNDDQKAEAQELLKNLS